jgi:hypothetical protein
MVKTSGQLTKKRRHHDANTHSQYKPKYPPEQYNSREGMQVSVWGPCIWTFLHCMSFNYPLNPTPQDKKNYRDFLLSLQNVLPCGKCRANLTKNFKKLPLTEHDMENRESFSRYLYNLHEIINTMLHKKSGLTYEEVRDRFEFVRAECKDKRKTQRKCHGKMNKTHKGCSEPIPGHIKSKCIIKIVPKTQNCKTLTINKKCLPNSQSCHSSRNSNSKITHDK